MIGELRQMSHNPEDQLMFIEKGGNCMIQVQNVSYKEATNKFYLIQGWSVRKKPVDLSGKWRAEYVDGKSCRLINKLK